MMNACSKAHRDRRRSGFTLVEVMIASAIGLLVIALSLSSFLALSYSSAGSVNAAAVHSRLRRAIDRMNTELIAADGFTTIWPDSYLVYNRITPDGRFLGALWHDKHGRLLYRWRDGRWRVFARGIDEMGITLFDDDGLPTIVASDAAAVSIRLGGSARVVRHTYTDEVFIRVLLRNRPTGGV